MEKSWNTSLALFSAVRQGNVEGINQALSYGANIKAVVKEEFLGPLVRALKEEPHFLTGSTPLIYATRVEARDLRAKCSKSKEGLSVASRVLIAAGADLNAKGETGLTPLHHAVLENNRESLDLLIDSGANVDVLSDWGYTPYQLATLIGRMGNGCGERKIFADRLLRAGAQKRDVPQGLTTPPSANRFVTLSGKREEWMLRTVRNSLFRLPTP